MVFLIEKNSRTRSFTKVKKSSRNSTRRSRRNVRSMQCPNETRDNSSPGEAAQNFETDIFNHYFSQHHRNFGPLSTSASEEPCRTLSLTPEAPDHQHYPSIEGVDFNSVPSVSSKLLSNKEASTNGDHRGSFGNLSTLRYDARSGTLLPACLAPCLARCKSHGAELPSGIPSLESIGAPERGPKATEPLRGQKAARGLSAAAPATPYPAPAPVWLFPAPPFSPPVPTRTVCTPGVAPPYFSPAPGPMPADLMSEFAASLPMFMPLAPAPPWAPQGWPTFPPSFAPPLGGKTPSCAQTPGEPASAPVPPLNFALCSPQFFPHLFLPFPDQRAAVPRRSRGSRSGSIAPGQRANAANKARSHTAVQTLVHTASLLDLPQAKPGVEAQPSTETPLGSAQGAQSCESTTILSKAENTPNSHAVTGRNSSFKNGSSNNFFLKKETERSRIYSPCKPGESPLRESDTAKSPEAASSGNRTPIADHVLYEKCHKLATPLRFSLVAVAAGDQEKPLPDLNPSAWPAQTFAPRFGIRTESR